MRSIRIITILFVLLFSAYSVFAQTSNVQFTKIDKSPKPTFEQFLGGLKAWEFASFRENGVEHTDNNGGNFMYAYWIKQFIQYMSDVCPNAQHGIDYRESMTSQALVIIDYNTATELTWSGTWKWRCNASIIFSDASTNYTYKFNIPEFSVNGGNFGDSKLINTLKKAITNRRIHYSSSNQLHLSKWNTHLTEASLNNYFSEGNFTPLEGIYESTTASKNNTQNKYKLALKEINGEYYLIYLDGASLYDDWQAGEVKAQLFKTASPLMFKANWIMLDKSVNTDYYINFDNGMMTVIDDDGEKEIYLKITSSPSNYIPTPQAETWSGTGFAIGNGCLVTNYHVIENAKSIHIQGVRGSFANTYQASVVGSDKNNDLAILKISDSQFNGFGTIPYKVKTSTSDVGEDIFVLGYPLTTTMGEEIKLTTGVISSKTGFQGDVSSYQISAPVQPGNSGGPLFDSKGNVIGIVSAKHVGAENVGYAIKASYLNSLVESLSGITLPTNNTLSSLSLSEKVKKVDDFIFLISCSTQTNSFNNSGVFSNSSTITQGNSRIINNPSVNRTTSQSTRIKKITLSPEYTSVEIVTNNQTSATGGFQWCTLDKGTHIRVNGTLYYMTRAEGINIAPEKTYFSYLGQELTFTLFFPPISHLNPTSMDLIEKTDSEWKWYGISLQ